MCRRRYPDLSEWIPRFGIRKLKSLHCPCNVFWTAIIINTVMLSDIIILSLADIVYTYMPVLITTIEFFFFLQTKICEHCGILYEWNLYQYGGIRTTYSCVFKYRQAFNKLWRNWTWTTKSTILICILFFQDYVYFVLYKMSND